MQLLISASQWRVGQLFLDAARVGEASGGDAACLRDLLQKALMVLFTPLWGEGPRIGAVFGAGYGSLG